MLYFAFCGTNLNDEDNQHRHHHHGRGYDDNHFAGGVDASRGMEDESSYV